MSLRGQDITERGYAMAALLVSLAVMAVMMSVVLPVWRHDAQREKEEELVFRGQQYVRAIRLFNRQTNALPTRVDDLVQGHYLRKKYKDPITDADFELVSALNPNPGGQVGTTQPGGRGSTQTIGGPPASTGRLGANSNSTPTSSFGGSVPGGILGVRSKSTDESIRLYLNRNHYNEWLFIFQGLGAGGGRGGQPPIGPGQFPGRGGPGGPGGPGGRGIGPGGRGIGPGFPPGGPGGFGVPPGIPPGRRGGGRQ